MCHICSIKGGRPFCIGGQKEGHVDPVRLLGRSRKPPVFTNVIITGKVSSEARLAQLPLSPLPLVRLRLAPL